MQKVRVKLKLGKKQP